MGVLLILPILVSGYILSLSLLKYRINTYKFEGQLLYLHVARLGMICLLLSAALVTFAATIFSHVFPVGSPLASPDAARDLDFLKHLGDWLAAVKLIEHPESGELWAFLCLVSLTSVFVPRPAGWLGDLTFRLRKGLNSHDALSAYLMSLSVESHPLNLAIIEAFTDRTSVMITMEDRKVYVGLITKICPPNEISGPNEEFHLVPLMSGYRDKDTLGVVYTTHYDEVLGSTVTPKPIILRQANITSLTEFDTAIRVAFSRDGMVEAR